MESGHRNPPLATAEEEVLKRNTDCVYFLASPLTCKKGNDCEYRHSEGARINPRDCWFWLNGNCMNAKCAFRHPPLEGFLGSPGGSAASLAASQAAFSMQMPAAYPTTGHNPSKQSVHCFYFQKGLCLKGDRCPFMHGSQPVENTAPRQSEKVCASVSEPPRALKRASGALEKCTTQQHVPQVNTEKPVEVASVMKPAAKAKILPSDGREAKKVVPLASVYDEISRYNSSNMPVVGGNDGSRHRGHHAPAPDENLQNGREAGEFLAESSPGFDVLVDDQHGNSDYCHHEDEYGRNPGIGGRHLNAMSEFDYDHSAELEPFAKFEREPYNELRDFDQCARAQDQYGWEHHKSVSDRILDRPHGVERRRPREESPDQIGRSDLRHRLLKQRKTNGSRYATSPDPFKSREDKYGEEQRYRGHPRREQKHLASEISMSSRLQGRIALPGRSSPDKAKDLRSDTEIDRRNRARSSPGRPGSNQHGKLNGRSRRMQDNFSMEVRGLRGQPNRRDETGMVNFAGPKSLAELKGAKVSDSSEERMAKNSNNGSAFKSGKIASHSQPEDSSFSFDGPKPLSEILKRKREAASGNGIVYGDGDNSNLRDRADQVGSSSAAEATETPTVDPIDSKEETAVNGDSGRTMLQNESNDKDALVINEGYDGPTSTEKEDAAEMEGSMIDTMEDQEFEEYDQRDDGDGEYEYYETGEGGEFKTEDENADPEDEYLEEDDGDDFSTRIGAMFS